MTNIIPLDTNASQEVSCTLSGQSCRFWIRQLRTGLYLDLWMNEQPLLAGCLCLDRVEMIQNPASPFPGELTFADQQGTQDPDYTGLGSRYLLLYTENSHE